MDRIIVEDGVRNEGYEARKRIAGNGQIFELYGHLHCDLFNQNKYMLNGIEVSIRLVKEKPEFCLMTAAGGETATFEITDANLYVRKIRINPSILVAHSRTLAVCPARYPITRVEIKSITINAGVRSKSVDNLFIGQIPKRYLGINIIFKKMKHL